MNLLHPLAAVLGHAALEVKLDGSRATALIHGPAALEKPKALNAKIHPTALDANYKPRSNNGSPNHASDAKWEPMIFLKIKGLGLRLSR